MYARVPPVLWNPVSRAQNRLRVSVNHGDGRSAPDSPLAGDAPMRRSHLLILSLALACSSPTDSGSDRPSLARASSGPTVTSTDPSGAHQDTTLDIHVLGSGFDKGSKVAFAR